MEAEETGAQLLGAVQKNAREQVRVTAREFKGYDLVDLRLWFEAGSDEYRPTQKGFSIRRELLPELLEVLQAAIAEEGRAAA